MPSEITKQDLIAIAESGEALEYLGLIDMSGEPRHYYRTTGVPGTRNTRHLVVYVVA